MYTLLLLLLSFQSGDLLDAVNSERGGRHWIDQKPAPPQSPELSRSRFVIEPGSRIELVAAEPLVMDPVWIDFDHNGRMFVAEYGDYPIGPVTQEGTADEAAAALSRIVLLHDDDADGTMDRRTVFADKLKFCHSFMPLMGGILAGAQTEIIFLKDTDGDDIADLREVWFDGFAPAHPQMQIGCPRWGVDGWIYLTYAPGKVRCLRPGFETKNPVTMPRQDMRFHPLTMEFQAITGLGQFGNTMDNDGHRFFCTNRNPIMMEMIPQDLANRNPFLTVSRRHTDVGPAGGATKVFPLVDMKSNWLSHAGTHTSACGVTAYRGDLWDAPFQHSVFACEPVGHLVTRSIVSPQPDSPAMTARPARSDADFLASTDTWFRPASLRTGPNGALYLADMYRMWVEHPKFLPPEIAARINWRAGEDRGRIWRIVPEKKRTPSERFRPLHSRTDIVANLNDSNGWRRSAAQRLLIEQQLKLNPDDYDVALAAGRGHTSLELLSTVGADGHNAGVDDKVTAAAWSDAVTREWLIRFASGRPSRSEVLDLCFQSAKEERSPQVRHQLALAAATSDSQHAGSALQAIVQFGHVDPWLQQSVLLAARESAGQLLTTTLRQNEAESKGSLLNALAGIVGRRGSEKEVSALMLEITSRPLSPPIYSSLLTGLAGGLPRHAGDLQAKSLSQLLAKPPAGASEAATVLRANLTSAAALATDSGRSTVDRIAAVQLLSVQSSSAVAEVALRVLSDGGPAALQLAILDHSGIVANPEVVQLLLRQCNTFGPSVRSQSLALLLARPGTTTQLLQEISDGRLAASAIDLDRRMRLLQHGDASIRTVAQKLFGGVVSADRRAVADEYQSAVTMESSAKRGAEIFLKTCSKCHRMNGKGHNVGPDISDTRNRSRDALLYDILDPNRRVDPQFSEYVVVTVDGRTFNGLLADSSGEQVTLRQPEGKELTILRSEIDEMQATSKSLMPVGIEKDVSIQQMADLLEFLKQR